MKTTVDPNSHLGDRLDDEGEAMNIFFDFIDLITARSRHQL
jgi:hypothetical protein